jgi:hypothetical protein
MIENSFKPITYYLFQAKVFCAQKTLAWKPVLQVPITIMSLEV